MHLSDFDYDLPTGLIATHPTADRRASRLLHVATNLHDKHFTDFPSLLRKDDLLVFNDTRVIHARLHGQKETGGKVELLLERIQGDTTALAHSKASKSPKTGCRIDLADGCSATVTARNGELFSLQFDRPVAGYISKFGEVPLPPYLGRDAESADDERYQTIYAREDGAVAAPTAGLHFDQAMLDETRGLGVRHCYVTLHVGAGTFQSLREENLADNRLHEERVRVSEDVCTMIAKTRAAGGRVIAVGTTSVRALEAASVSGGVAVLDGETSLFIYPGYEFRTVDCMLTNFHLPQSSSLMLVSAFAGREKMLAAYAHAVREKYRFFSYGDAMFIDRQTAL